MDRVRFLDNPGGRPNTEDENLFEQNAIRNAFKAMAKMFYSKWATETGDENIQNAVMWGCEVTVGTPSTTRDVSAGYVIIEGELYEVEATNVDVIGETEPLIFATAGTTNTTNRTFKSGTAYPVREERRAAVASYDMASVSIPASSVCLSQSPADDSVSTQTESQSLVGGVNGTRGATFVPFPYISGSKRDSLTTSGFFQVRDIIYNYDENAYQYLDDRGYWWNFGRLTEVANTAAISGPRRGDQILDLAAGKIKFYTGTAWETVTSTT